jgi:hypothetical protein
MTESGDAERRSKRRSSVPPRLPRDEIKSQLRRLGRASRSVDIVRELQRLAPRLQASGASRALPLGSLTALAEGHLLDRREPSRDPLTGLLDAAAFEAAWRDQGEHTRGDRETDDALAVTVTVCGLAHACEARLPALLRQLAAACVEAVALGDLVGRVSANTLAVLPLNGGTRGAERIAARLQRVCDELVRNQTSPLRVEVGLRARDGSGVRRAPLSSDARRDCKPCTLCDDPQPRRDSKSVS